MEMFFNNCTLPTSSQKNPRQLCAFHVHPALSCLMECGHLLTASCSQVALPLPHRLLISTALSFCSVGHRSRSCQLRLESQLPAVRWPVQYSALACPSRRLFVLILGGEEQSSLKTCSLTHQKNLLHHRVSCRADYGKQSCCHQAVSKELLTVVIRRDTIFDTDYSSLCFFFFPFQYANAGLLVKGWMKHSI